MLRHLRVTNFAILSDVAVELVPGMNVLTGETGAGKSLIVEAVNLLRGGRASADIPRAGAKEAVVEAIFEIPDDLEAAVAALLEESGLPSSSEASAGEVLVRRVIHKGGRSRTYINGALTTAGRLAEIGGLLVDLSGQHQHQGLVDPARHRAILDSFVGRTDLTEAMAATWEALRAARAELDDLGGDERVRAERIDYLRFQLEEIDSLEPGAGEDEELEVERSRLESADKLESGARAAEDLVYASDSSAVDQVAAAVRELERLAAIDRTLEPAVRQLEEARALLEDAAADLRHYAGAVEGDPRRLAQVEDRLDRLRKLARKHGGSVDTVLARAEELRAELAGLENRGERLAVLEGEVATREQAARAAAAALSKSRRDGARDLCRRACEALAELGMGSSELSVDLQARELGATGGDHIELLLRSNKGEDAKPLSRIASGGELSRIMLAVKLVLRRADEVATYVFDEVDTGIGGATAEVVGRQIRAIADQRQVLCVTHLAQIAAFADGHYHVSKFEQNGRTETAVRRLTDTERRDETARMLGGAKLTPRAKAHAAEMLRSARP